MGLSDIRDLINLELPQLNEALAPNRTSTQVHAVQNNVNTEQVFLQDKSKTFDTIEPLIIFKTPLRNA